MLFPDHFDNAWRAGSRERILREVAQLQPGVTELHVQPAVDTPEVRAISPDAEGWIDDLDLIMAPALREALDAVGAVRIGYRDLRDLMRSEARPATRPEADRSRSAAGPGPSGVGLEHLGGRTGAERLEEHARVARGLEPALHVGDGGIRGRSRPWGR